ncbi:MAG: YncE family protein [Treponema sp.]|nr:YncE family protein [Treponema sp.]
MNRRRFNFIAALLFAVSFQLNAQNVTHLPAAQNAAQFPAQSATQFPAQKIITLKSAPHNLDVYFNGELLKPVSYGNGLRNYRLSGDGTLQFSAAGYRPQIIHSESLPDAKGIVGIKLENTGSVMQLRGEYKTGAQPKSVYFSPDGKRLFVPLLNQHGIDVFYQKKGYLIYEKRLTVPNSKAIGFVEALCDAKRRELWVSNMLENKVHIYDLDTLEYKLSINTGGVYPKVIVQSPDSKLTIASNWDSMDLSVFDSDSKRLLRRIPVTGTPRGMAFSPDSSLLYVAIYDEPLIVVVNLEQNRIVSRFRLYPGAGAARHVIYNDGKLYVSDMLRGTVNILNASTGALLHSKRVGMNINTIVLSPCGRYVFASSRGTNHPEDYTLPGPDFGAVYMLDARDLTLREKIWGRNQPTGLAVSPDGKYMVFTDFLDANLEWYSLF